MIINLLVGVVILIAIFIAYYLLSHLNKKLFGINVQDNERMAKTAKTGGITFILLAILGVIASLSKMIFSFSLSYFLELPLEQF
ncbi:hypothetical protein [Lentilactobacillus kisonensis]|uniref:hypothetical protein n=1 Tax=Lentilactobacillus kisonensis TaxID=481722 RepID=UPI000A89EA5E|nr:hypothetical protein [Lentilactobacillus kisonensis]